MPINLTTVAKIAFILQITKEISIYSIFSHHFFTIYSAFSFKSSTYPTFDLTNIHIPDTIKIIKFNAFLDCTGLKSVTIPASVEEIENNAFPESITN